MVATLVERMDRSRVLAAVATLDRPGPVARRLASSGVPVRSLGGRGLVVAFVRLARLLRHQRFDVVNAYGFKSTAVVRVLMRVLARRAVFVSGVRGLHVSELEALDGLKSRLVLALERLGSPLVDVYDANSQGALALLEQHGVDRARLRYIPNGIDAGRWKVSRSPRSESSPPVVLCVARFVARKRHQDLVLAAAQLAREGVDFRLVLAGDGPTLEATRRLAAASEAAALVSFVGTVEGERLRDLLRDADLFCLPSLWEGMAGSVMEAMASGLPVVGTRVNGIAELIEHGRSGLLVKPDCPAELAAGLRALIEAPDKRRAFGAAGRERMTTRFSVERMVSAKEELFLSLAGPV